MFSAIRIENLSKQYRLGLVGTGTLSHDIRRWWYLTRGREDPYLRIGEENDRSIKSSSDYIWALKEINFEVQPGEVLGIIGRNGAGKSTLLKILSKITSPTSGRISYKGRIASLLEVGTGFHPELTGRENIYLNGAILGMNKNEIRNKFEEIVDFSGCERYVDTPVKRYSTGMTVRLGFAVAAFLEPEILVVDEVLAVGDAEFQKKAVGKIHEVSQGNGRTVLFVSHNMSAIQNLCSNTLLLNNGKLVCLEKTETAINRYLQITENEKVLKKDFSDIKRKGLGNIIFKEISLNNSSPIRSGSDIDISFKLLNKLDTEIRNLKVDIGIDNNQNVRIAHLSNNTLNEVIYLLPGQETEITYTIRNLPLVAGRYCLSLYCEAAGQVQDWIKDAYYFDIDNADFYRTGKLPPAGHGSILLNYTMKQT
jgi:lipopolysaccharide transport system ATP-binding protein